MNLAQAIYLDERGYPAWREPLQAVFVKELERYPVHALAALACGPTRPAGVTRRHYRTPEQRKIRQGTLADRFLQGLRHARSRLNYPEICACIHCEPTRANREVLTELVRIGRLQASGSRTHRIYWHPSLERE